MRYQSVWLRTGSIYVPTVGMMATGVLCDVDPVAVLPAEREALASVLAQRLAEQPPIVAAPPKVPVLATAAGVRNWKRFAEVAVGATLEESPDGWTVVRVLADGQFERRAVIPAGADSVALANSLLVVLADHIGGE